jgi:hypothetical protein
VSTTDRIRQAVLRYFRRRWPNVNERSNFADDFGLAPQQVLDYGTELAEQLGCYPTRSQILGCKTVGALITLLVRTAAQVRAVLAEAEPTPPKRRAKKSPAKRKQKRKTSYKK